MSNKTDMSSFIEKKSPSKSLSLKGQEGGSNYILCLNLSHDLEYVAVASSNHCVNIIDLNTLQVSNMFKPHSNTINCLRPSYINNNIWLTSSSDKSIKGWDVRVGQGSGNPIFMKKLDDEIYSFALSSNNTLLSVGAGNNIEFYDIRKVFNDNAPSSSQTNKYNKIDCYEDIHSDIITQLDFTPSDTSLLVSASEDGLICVHDTKMVDEDDITISTLNIGCPIRKFGFFGSQYEGIYSISTIETLSCWHHPTSQCLMSYENIRETYELDYLVDGYYNSVDDELSILGGNYDGNGKLFTVHPQLSTDENITMKNNYNNVELKSLLMPGHTDVIRACCHLPSWSQYQTYVNGDTSNSCTHIEENLMNVEGNDLTRLQPHVERSERPATNNILLTGGEDSQLCLWNS